MKRIISFLLSLCLMVEIFSINANAEELQTKYINISTNGDLRSYECLLDGQEIFCSADDFIEITGYSLNEIVLNEKENIYVYEYTRKYSIDQQGNITKLQTKNILDVNNVSNTVSEQGVSENNVISELQTSVTIRVENGSATVEAMGKEYDIECNMSNGKILFPLEKMLYLLHTDWYISGNTLCTNPLGATILDFINVHGFDINVLQSQAEDLLIDTGWLFSDNEWGQRVYSTVAEVFNDFDGKIFLLWWPGEGHVETAQGYEDAILQLAKDDSEFIGEDVQKDAVELVADTAGYLNESLSQIQNIASVPENIDDVVQSIPDAVSVLEDIPNYEVSKKLKTISEKIEDGEIDTLFLSNPEVKAKTKQLGDIGDGLGLLQCVWNACDVASRVAEWDEEYLEQLDILANYDKPYYISSNIEYFVETSAQRLIDSYQEPLEAAFDEALQSTFGFFLNKVLDESPIGKACSIMSAVGTSYGTFNTESKETTDVYAELSVVTFSIKIEHLIRELFEYENNMIALNGVTNEKIENCRNQLMLYLRLMLRNKAQLYNLNVRGNKNEDWVSTEEAVEMHEEIVKIYAMLAELIETKDNDSRIILDKDLDDIQKIESMYHDNILLDDMHDTNEDLEQEITGAYGGILDMFYNSISCNWSNCDGEGCENVYDPDNTCYLFWHYLQDYSLDEIGYTMLDLNNDGQSELIVSPFDVAESGEIYDLYAISNGEIIHVASAGERWKYNLAKDYSINAWGSSSALTSDNTNYCLAIEGEKLKINQRVIYDGYIDEANPYFYSTEEHYNMETDEINYEVLKSITKEEATDIRNSFPENISIELIPFSQYVSNEDTTNTNFSFKSENELKALAESHGIVSAWEYADYDGNGTKEAFAIITDEELNVLKTLFVSSDGESIEIEDDLYWALYTNDEGYIRYAGEKGFFWADMGAYGSGWISILYSVKENIPYKLQLSGEIQGFYKEGDIFLYYRK